MLDCGYWKILDLKLASVEPNLSNGVEQYTGINVNKSFIYRLMMKELQKSCFVSRQDLQRPKKLTVGVLWIGMTGGEIYMKICL